MWSAIASVLLGLAGWIVASFLGKPWLDFQNLRGQVHEEIIFTANVVAGALDYSEAVNSLRRLGAKVQATNIAASCLLRCALSKVGYDLVEASNGLIGLSNSLANDDGSLALHKNSIQVGLKLPRDYSDKQVRQIEEKISRGKS